MRNGRPCNCGCDTCSGYPCSLYDATGVWCPDDAQNYLSFSEGFDIPLQSGWDLDAFGASNSRGIIQSGNYVYDSVTGSSLRSPMICAHFYGSVTFYSTDYNHYYGKFGYSGGPEVLVSSGNAYLLTPTGTVQIDSQFNTGDNYRIELVHSRYSDSIEQNLKVKKRRNATTIQSSCAATTIQVTPYPTGCPYAECTLYNETYIDPTGTLFTLDSPVKAYVALSGTAYQCDDVCFNAYELSGSNLIGAQTFDSECHACGNTIAVSTAIYGVPCINTDDPWIYDDNIYLLWQAYKDDYLDPDNAAVLRCAPLPGSSVYVYLRTEIKSYAVDLTEADIWHLTPLAVDQYFTCYDSTPFDTGNTDCNVVGFSGAPCNSSCYSPPYFSLDSIAFNLDDETKQGAHRNVSLVDNVCRQVGSDDLIFNIGFGTPIDTLRLEDYGYSNLYGGAPDRGVEDLVTIPRNDRYSTVKHIYSTDEGDMDDTIDAWSVENISYKINWDSTNRWWSGNMRHLGGSGVSVMPNPGGTGVTSSQYEGTDLSIIYSDGQQCENNTMYIYSKCSPNGERTSYIDILSSGGDILSRVTVPNDYNNGFYETNLVDWLYSTAVYGLHGDHHDWVGCIGQVGSDYSWEGIDRVPIMSETFYYNQHDLGDSAEGLIGVSLIDDCTCACPSGDLLASGAYQYTLYGKPGFLLNVGEDYDPSYLPSVMLDCMGAPIIRGIAYKSIGGEFGNVWEASDPVLPGDCIFELGYGPAYYDLVSGNTVNYLFSETDSTVQSSSALLMQCSGSLRGIRDFDGGIPIWGGNVIGHVYNNSLVALTGTSYAPEEYDTFGYHFHDMVTVVMFLDKQNNDLKAFIRPNFCFHNNEDGVNNLPAGNPADWSHYPQGFYKSESDIINNNYFADVTVLDTNPLKVKLIQSFMAYGQTNDNPEECELYQLYGFNIEVILEAPTLI